MLYLVQHVESSMAKEASLLELSFKGRRALVTGSTRGIGWHIATALRETDADVIVHGRSIKSARAASERLKQLPGNGDVSTAVFDVTDEAAIAAETARLESEGPIDILVNNAGIQIRQPLLEISLADWERVIATNLDGPFLVGRHVAAGMVSRGRGRIINIGSVQADLARPGIGPYTAAKGGVRNLTRAMAAEWAPSGLTVNAIAPGYIHTEMTQALVDDQQFNEWIVGRTPARRWGTPADVTGPVIWLASELAGFVNGQTIFVDGGMTVVV